MPLYMDIHIVEDEAFSEIAAMIGHHRDIAVQHRFGVKSIKYFLNLHEKKVFCLMEAPNKKACIDNHLAAHGIGPCNVIEVSREIDFKAFLGEGNKNESDLALTLSGEIDTGYRTLMMISLMDFTGECGHHIPIEEVHQLVQGHRGQIINQPNDKIMASFVHAADAISCGLASSALLKSNLRNIHYTIALVTGKPVDEVGSDFFGEAKEHLQMLCQIGLGKTVYIDTATNALAKRGSHTLGNEKSKIQFVSENDFSSYRKLFQILDEKLTEADFKSVHLCKSLGLSKARTYRKLKSLTGMSPNELIREMRLRRSLNALKENTKTVAEIAYEHGFNSPTYFTRVFRRRFGVLPTSFAKLSIGR